MRPSLLPLIETGKPLGRRGPYEYNKTPIGLYDDNILNVGLPCSRRVTAATVGSQSVEVCLRGRFREFTVQEKTHTRLNQAVGNRTLQLMLASLSMMMSHGFKSSKQDFTFGPWKVTASKTHIMKSKDIERLSEDMSMPSLPEMLFGDNVLRIQHADGYGIEFNAVDALKRVNNMEDAVKVACAQEWQESRAEAEHSTDVIRPYDWTYTTDYRGTLIGEGTQMQVSKTAERIDMEKLKAREHIMFFDEVLLFEDELHDHGVSMLSVKIRVMPTSFFLLMRFFLRVDGVLIRINDTRLYHEAGKVYMLREFSTRESKIADLKNVPAPLYTDPNEIAQHLTLKMTECEKLELPVLQTHTAEEKVIE